MERRHSKRIIINFKAEVILGSKNYSGFVKNLSKDGIHMITLPTDAKSDFSPGKTVELRFQGHTGGTSNLYCKVKWSDKLPPYRLANTIGMEIIDIP